MSVSSSSNPSLTPANTLMHAPYVQESTCSTQFKTFWGYAGKTLLATRYHLNAIARNTTLVGLLPTDAPDKIKSSVLHLKLFSIIGVPYKISDLSNLSSSFVKSVLINDREGIAITSLTFALLIADLFDSIQSYLNAMLALTLTTPFEILPAAAMPAGLIMSCSGTILRITRITKACNLHANLTVFKGKAENERISFLKDSLGIAELEHEIKAMKQLVDTLQRAGSDTKPEVIGIQLLMEKKEAILARMIPKEAKHDYAKLMELLNQETVDKIQVEDAAEINSLVSNIQSHLVDKGLFEAVGLLSNILILSAIFCLTIGIVTSMPYFLFATAFTVRLGMHIHECNLADRLAFHESLQQPFNII